MENIKFGEIAVLEDGKEFICFSSLDYNDNNYVYLVSNYKPWEVRFAKQINDGHTLKLEIVTDKDEKEKLLELFKNKTNQ